MTCTTVNLFRKKQQSPNMDNKIYNSQFIQEKTTKSKYWYQDLGR